MPSAFSALLLELILTSSVVKRDGFPFFRLKTYLLATYFIFFLLFTFDLELKSPSTQKHIIYVCFHIHLLNGESVPVLTLNLQRKSEEPCLFPVEKKGTKFVLPQTFVVLDEVSNLLYVYFILCNNCIEFTIVYSN